MSNDKLAEALRDAEATVLAFLGDVAFDGSVCGIKRATVKGMFARLQAHAAEAELAEARETIKRLNRRVQIAEAGVAEKVKASAGRSLGRAMANAAADAFMHERDEAQAELAALQARIDALMLEFCPEDMTEEQVAAWSARQRVVDEPQDDNAKEGRSRE